MFTRPEDKKGQEKVRIPTTKFSMQLNVLAVFLCLRYIHTVLIKPAYTSLYTVKAPNIDLSYLISTYSFHRLSFSNNFVTTSP